jgi:hypothetical protein
MKVISQLNKVKSFLYLFFILMGFNKYYSMEEFKDNNEFSQDSNKSNPLAYLLNNLENFGDGINDIEMQDASMKLNYNSISMKLNCNSIIIEQNSNNAQHTNNNMLNNIPFTMEQFSDNFEDVKHMADVLSEIFIEPQTFINFEKTIKNICSKELDFAQKKFIDDAKRNKIDKPSGFNRNNIMLQRSFLHYITGYLNNETKDMTLSETLSFCFSFPEIIVVYNHRQKFRLDCYIKNFAIFKHVLEKTNHQEGGRDNCYESYSVQERQSFNLKKVLEIFQQDPDLIQNVVQRNNGLLKKIQALTFLAEILFAVAKNKVEHQWANILSFMKNIANLFHVLNEKIANNDQEIKNIINLKVTNINTIAIDYIKILKIIEKALKAEYHNINICRLLWSLEVALSLELMACFPWEIRQKLFNHYQNFGRVLEESVIETYENKKQCNKDMLKYGRKYINKQEWEEKEGYKELAMNKHFDFLWDFIDQKQFSPEEKKFFLSLSRYYNKNQNLKDFSSVYEKIYYMSQGKTNDEHDEYLKLQPQKKKIKYEQNIEKIEENPINFKTLSVNAKNLTKEQQLLIKKRDEYRNGFFEKIPQLTMEKFDDLNFKKNLKTSFYNKKMNAYHYDIFKFLSSLIKKDNPKQQDEIKIPGAKRKSKIQIKDNIKTVALEEEKKINQWAEKENKINPSVDKEYLTDLFQDFLVQLKDAMNKVKKIDNLNSYMAWELILVTLMSKEFLSMQIGFASENPQKKKNNNKIIHEKHVQVLEPIIQLIIKFFYKELRGIPNISFNIDTFLGKNGEKSDDNLFMKIVDETGEYLVHKNNENKLYGGYFINEEILNKILSIESRYGNHSIFYPQIGEYLSILKDLIAKFITPFGLPISIFKAYLMQINAIRKDSLSLKNPAKRQIIYDSLSFLKDVQLNNFEYELNGSHDITNIDNYIKKQSEEPIDVKKIINKEKFLSPKEQEFTVSFLHFIQFIVKKLQKDYVFPHLETVNSPKNLDLYVLGSTKKTIMTPDSQHLLTISRKIKKPEKISTLGSWDLLKLANDIFTIKNESINQNTIKKLEPIFLSTMDKTFSVENFYENYTMESLTPVMLFGLKITVQEIINSNLYVSLDICDNQVYNSLDRTYTSPNMPKLYKKNLYTNNNMSKYISWYSAQKQYEFTKEVHIIFKDLLFFAKVVSSFKKSLKLDDNNHTVKVFKSKGIVRIILSFLTLYKLDEMDYELLIEGKKYIVQE